MPTRKTSTPQSKTYSFHPLANEFELMGGGEYAELVEDIRAHGQIEPIVLLDDQILDGRNRYRACQEAGVEPTYRPFTGDDPVAFVIHANIRRRHLDAEQKHRVLHRDATRGPHRKSDRQVGKLAKADDKTVAAVRADLEGREEIPHVELRTDSKGRKQPRRRKSKTKAGPDVFTGAGKIIDRTDRRPGNSRSSCCRSGRQPVCRRAGGVRGFDCSKRAGRNRDCPRR